MAEITVIKLKPRKTVEDYLRLPDDVRAELIEGDLFMTPAPTWEHQGIVLQLVKRLDDTVQAGNLGEVRPAPVDVHLPSGDIVQPDVVYVAAAHRGMISGAVRGTPDLVIEVISGDRPERDRLAKRDLYARNGVPEYWIVDPESRAIEVYRLQGNVYAVPALFESGDDLTSPVLPGLSLPVKSVFPV